jgi:hypothetical protein
VSGDDEKLPRWEDEMFRSGCGERLLLNLIVLLLFGALFVIAYLMAGNSRKYNHYQKETEHEIHRNDHQRACAVRARRQ